LRVLNAHSQELFDCVYKRHSGQPIEAVQAALKRAALSRGIPLAGDPMISAMAEAISRGIKLEVGAT
jgi:hypothetical protein